MFQVERMMCQGVMRLASGLSVLGMLPAPSAASFNSDRERYEQRFGFLKQLLRPEYLPYEDFMQSTLSEGVPADRILLGSYESFAKAQSGLMALSQSLTSERMLGEHEKHLGGVKKIASMNMMALKILIQSISGPHGVEVPPFKATWDFKVAMQHSDVLYYPTLTLKSDKK